MLRHTVGPVLLYARLGGLLAVRCAGELSSSLLTSEPTMGRALR